MTKCTSEDYVRTYQYLKNEISRIQLGKQKLSDKIALAEFSTFKGEYEGLFEAVRGELKSFTETLESTAGGEQNCAMSSGITARVVKREVDRCNQLSTRISRDRSLVAAFNKMKLVKRKEDRQKFHLFVLNQLIYSIYFFLFPSGSRHSSPRI